MIVPSILVKNRKELHERLLLAEGHVPRVQIDVLDGKFALNTTVSVSALWNIKTPLKIDFQLMVVEPYKYIQQLLPVGWMFTVHIESFHSAQELQECISFLRRHKKKVCLALNVQTSLQRILPFVSLVDQILFMTVPCGFSGQRFRMSVLKKIRSFHVRYPSVPLAVDGGVNPRTLLLAKKGGATVFIGSYMYHGDFVERLRKLQKVERS